MTTATAGRTLRPFRHLPWPSIAAGNIAIVLPGATVAIVLAARHGRPVVAAAVALVTAAYAAVVIVPALRIRVILDEVGLRSSLRRRRLRMSPVARTDVQRALLRTIYNSDGVTTDRHLFLLDQSDRTVLRLSGRWWTEEQLLAVAQHVDVPVEPQDQPVHLAEIRRGARYQLRWGERHRWAATSVLVAGSFVLCLALAAVTDSAL